MSEADFLPEDPDVVFAAAQGDFSSEVQELINGGKHTAAQIQNQACFKLIFELKYKAGFLGLKQVTIEEAIRQGIIQNLKVHGPMHLAYDQDAIESLVCDEILLLVEAIKSGKIAPPWPPKIRV